MVDVRAVRVYLSVESDSEIPVYTGQVVKTLIYALNREVRLYHGVRGVVSPVHISPLFKPGKRENELGEVVTPLVIKNKERKDVVVPVKLGGEYIVHVGGERQLVDLIAGSLEKLRAQLAVKLGDAIITYRVEKVSDVTGEIMAKTIDDRVTLYLKAPVKPFNIFVPSKLPKYSISAIELLYVGYMFHSNNLTTSERQVLSAGKILGLLVETYYSINTVKPVLVPLKPGKKEPGLIGKVTYIVDTDNPNTRQQITAVLSTAEAVGIGESRTNGFGTITFTGKKRSL